MYTISENRNFFCVHFNYSHSKKMELYFFVNKVVLYNELYRVYLSNIICEKVHNKIGSEKQRFQEQLKDIFYKSIIKGP